MMRDSLLYFFINEILLFIFSLSFLKYNHMLGKKKMEKSRWIPSSEIQRAKILFDYCEKGKKEKKTLETRQLDTVYTRPSHI